MYLKPFNRVFINQQNPQTLSLWACPYIKFIKSYVPLEVLQSWLLNELLRLYEMRNELGDRTFIELTTFLFGHCTIFLFLSCSLISVSAYKLVWSLRVNYTSHTRTFSFVSPFCFPPFFSFFPAAWAVANTQITHTIGTYINTHTWWCRLAGWAWLI